MKKFLALVCTLCLLLTALPLTALAADDDWVTLNVEMYDRSIAGFNVEDCWQLRYIQENFGDPNHIKINWIPVSRWEEGTILSTRLAGGTGHLHDLRHGFGAAVHRHGRHHAAG